MSQFSMMESTKLITDALLSLAGSARLPPTLVIKESIIDESSILQTLEIVIQDYIKSKPNFGKNLHNKVAKLEIYNDIFNIINQFEFTIKEQFIQLWKIFLLDSLLSDSEIKIIIQQFSEKINNKKIKAYIESNTRNTSKFTSVIKTILNISPPFNSIFIQDSLSKAEQIAYDNVIRINTRYSTILDTFLDMVDLLTPSSEDMNIIQFFGNVHKISDPKIRNDYYNSYLKLIVSKLTTKVGREIIPVSNPSIERIFVQLYLYLINNEIIKTVDPIITNYIRIKNINWFTFQVTELSDKLYPNWNFKVKGFVLDDWQKNCIKQIDEKKNILLCLPTSAGKTIISTYTIRKYQKVIYIVPSEALAYQLTGIILASLLDMNKKDDELRNVRQETLSLQYKLYPDKKDDIIIATPKEFYNLISTKQIDPHFDYVIIDEFHNISSDIGKYIEYILKFAGYFSIPVICLSATIPNYSEVFDWLTRILDNEIYGVYENKRFFNQKRMVIKNNNLVTVNVLENMTPEIVRSPTFTHIGLYPKEILNLYQSLPIERINEQEPKVTSLDKMFLVENSIFNYLKTLNDTDLNNVISNKNVTTDQLTIYQLYKVIKLCQEKRITPMLIFKMDSIKCMEIYNKIIEMLKDYQQLVYPNINKDQEIIQQFFDMFDQESKKIKLSRDPDGKDGSIEKEKTRLKDALYGGPGIAGGVYEQLEIVYEQFITCNLPNEDLSTKPLNITIDEKEAVDNIGAFNTKYGADLTRESIIMLRKKHVKNQMQIYNSPENLCLRNIFTPHADCRFSTSSISFDEMRKIRRRIQAEISRETRIKRGPNASVLKIDYNHPFMVGIEHGILCYNELLDPAFLRVTQQLINTNHSFITFSDKSLAVGINYPIKTVMLLGGLRGEPIEDLNNTTAHQAIGRAGRRGLDAEGFIIYSGVNLTNLLIPQFNSVVRNPIEVMQELFTDESDAFKRYVIDEIRPAIPEDLWSINFEVDIDKIANEIFITRSLTENLHVSKLHNEEFIEFIADCDTIRTQQTLETIKDEIRKEIEFSKFKSKIPTGASSGAGSGAGSGKSRHVDNDDDDEIQEFINNLNTNAPSNVTIMYNTNKDPSSVNDPTREAWEDFEFM